MGRAGIVRTVLMRRMVMQIINKYTTVRLKVEENQLVDVFGEIRAHIEGLKGA